MAVTSYKQYIEQAAANGKLKQWPVILSATEYVAGLKAIEPNMSALQKKLLIAHYYCAERITLTPNLAQLVGVPNHNSVNLHYGRLGTFLRETLSYTDQQIKKPGGWSVWSRGCMTPDGFIWEMLPAVAEALEMLGWVNGESATAVETTNFIPPQLRPRKKRQTAVRPHKPIYRAGTTVLRSEKVISREVIYSGYVRQIHSRLQNSLFTDLCRQFGEGKVILERGYVDIRVELPDGSIELYEIKSDLSAEKAIRQALGQLLHYGFTETSRGKSVAAFIIAARGELTSEAESYLQYVRQMLNIDLRYLTVELPDEEES